MDSLSLKERFQIHANEAIDQIVIDGLVEEQTWLDAEVGTDFWQKLPYFAEHTDPKTEVRLAYDDKFLYVSAICFQEGETIIQSLKRDLFWDSDGIAMMIDPMNNRSTGNIFGVTSAGVQYDGQRYGSTDVNENWNNRWFSESHYGEGFWSMEMAIPLKILRFKEGNTAWGVNFVRGIMHKNEFHNWTAVPESFWPVDPAYGGTLIWDTPPASVGLNYNVIPYVSTAVVKEQNEDPTLSFNAGLDARMALSTRLNLDLTINPDFSQIEADELVTNLTRFDLFLPEKRTFFLENGDLFSEFGFPFARPFFSRKIGLDDDGNAVPILYGLRLTGNVRPDLRMGIMNIHSLGNKQSPAQNQSAVSLQKSFGRSIIQGLVLNRQAYDHSEVIQDDYGRNVSLEGVYVSDDGEFSTWLGLHRSFQPSLTVNTGFYNTGILYTDASWEILFDMVRMEDNYHADMGFIARIENYDAERDTTIRLGYNQSFTMIKYKIRPRKGSVSIHEIGLENFIVLNPDWSFNERANVLSYNITSRNGQKASLGAKSYSTKLLYPYSFTEETPLPIGFYHHGLVGLSYQSDIRKAFSYDVSAEYGSFYNGSIISLASGLKYRIQPWGNFSVKYQWNNLKFPTPYGQNQISSLISKVEIGFSKDLLWTSLFQYVDQSDFIGINTRLQWRFAPMSDLYLVYLDNYDTFHGLAPSDLISNNRTFVLKINYWY